eukprot:6202707-Pleurochrysis_carterae.AAC.3
MRLERKGKRAAHARTVAKQAERRGNAGGGAMRQAAQGPYPRPCGRGRVVSLCVALDRSRVVRECSAVTLTLTVLSVAAVSDGDAGMFITLVLLQAGTGGRRGGRGVRREKQFVCVYVTRECGRQCSQRDWPVSAASEAKNRRAGGSGCARKKV